MEYAKFKQYLHMVSQKVRKLYVESKLRSILDYGLPLYMGESEATRNRLRASFMTLNRIIHGGITFKVNSNTICKRIKVKHPEKHITNTAAQFIQKQLFHKKCPALTSKMLIPKRNAGHIYMRMPQAWIYPSSIDKLVGIHNRLPQNLKTMNPPWFKRYLRKNDI